MCQGIFIFIFYVMFYSSSPVSTMKKIATQIYHAVNGTFSCTPKVPRMSTRRLREPRKCRAHQRDVFGKSRKCCARQRDVSGNPENVEYVNGKVSFGLNSSLQYRYLSGKCRKDLLICCKNESNYPLFSFRYLT